MGGPDPLIGFCLATDKKFQKAVQLDCISSTMTQFLLYRANMNYFASSIFYGNYYILRLYLCRTC